MLRKLRATLCCGQVDGDANHPEPAIPRPEPTSDRNSLATATTSPVQDPADPADLWQIAFLRLDPKRQLWLSTEDQAPDQVIQKVIDETKKKYDEYQSKGLTIRRRGGDEIKVRDVAQNILESALNAQEIVKTVVSFDPTGHASSAWAIVSLGLTMVRTDIGRRDAIFEASAYLADRLAFFTVLEHDCRYRGVASDKKMGDALIEAYVSILEYSAQVRKTHDESLGARIGSTLIPLTEQPLQKLREVVEAKTAAVQKWATVGDRSDLKRQATDILAAIDRHTEEMLKMRSTVLSVEDKGILEWLSQSDYSDIQRSSQDHRTEGTGQWLMDLESYQNWKAVPGGIFWVHGAAGCGKSVICSTVIQSISGLCREDPAIRCAYWYFQFNDVASQKVEHMLRCIIRQLHSSPLDHSITSIWKEHGTKGSQPSNSMLLQTLHSVINAYSGKIYLILDALDECPESVERKERGLLLSVIRECQQRHQGKIHILVTSRPEPDIVTKLNGSSTLDLEEEQESDISTFVNLKVGALDDRIAPKEVKARIVGELLQHEKQRFRWADLQVKRLEECRSKQGILDALDTVPTTLEETYCSVIDRIKPCDREYARLILTWLSFAAVPLTLEQVAEAAGLEVPEDVLRICTTSFVTFRRLENRVSLSHFSVKEFLISSNGAAHWYSLSNVSGHAMLAEKSLQLLLQQTVILSQDNLSKLNLLNYASHNWHAHFKGAVRISPNQQLQKMVDDLFRHPIIYSNWRCLASDFYELDSEPTAIGKASDLGLIDTVHGLLDEGADPLELFKSGPSRHLTNAVLDSARQGYLDILDLLLKGVSISAGTAESIMQIVRRHIGATTTLKDVVDTLSDSGVIYVEKGGQNECIDERMVIAAAENTVCGLELMTMLLDQCEEMPVTEAVLDSTLYNQGCGHDILQLLLDRRGADVHIYPRIREIIPYNINNRTLTLLLQARHTEIELDESFIASFAESGDGTTMGILLNISNNDQLLTENVLQKAASNQFGTGALRQILLRQEYQTPISDAVLCAAVEEGNQFCVEMLGILLDRCGPDFVVGETVMLSVLRNWDPSNAHDMLDMLLRRQQTFTVNHAVLSQAAHNYCSKDIIEILMNNGGLDIMITEDILLGATYSNDVLSYLLDLEQRSQINELPFTDEVFARAIMRLDTTSDALQVVLRKRPEFRVTEDMLVEASLNPPLLSILLQQPHCRLPTLRILERLARYNLSSSADRLVFQLLLDEGNIDLDERTTETLAGNFHAWEVLLKKDPHVAITEKALIKAASREDALCLLLDKRIEDLPMSEEVMIAVAGGDSPVANLRRILAYYGPMAPITEEVLVASTTTLEALQLLLTAPGPHAPLPVSEKVVVLATLHNWRALPWLIQERQSEILLTERVLVAATASSPFALQWLLRKRPTDIDLNHVWRAIWQPDRSLCGFYHGSSSSITPGDRMRAARNILNYTREVDLSEELFTQTFTIPYKPEDSSLLALIKICVWHDLRLPATDQFIGLVLEKCGTDLIEAICEYFTMEHRGRGQPATLGGDFARKLLRGVAEKKEGRELMGSYSPTLP